MMAALFLYHRAKLGYGLLSGKYSKPAPDPGEENGASEPRVRINTVTMVWFNTFSWHMWDLLSEISETEVQLIFLSTLT